MIAIVDRINNYTEMILLSNNKILTPCEDGIFLYEKDGIEYYNILLPSNIEYQKIITITVSNLSGLANVQLCNFSNKAFNKLIQNNLNLMQTKHLYIGFSYIDVADDNKYKLYPYLPIIEISGKPSIVVTNESHCKITLHNIDNTTKMIVPTTNNYSSYKMFTYIIDVLVDLTLYNSTLQNAGLDINTLIYLYSKNTNLVTEYITNVSKILSSGLYLINNQDISVNKMDKLCILPSNELVLSNMFNNSEIYVFDLLWFEDNSFTKVINEPETLLHDQTYHVKVPIKYPEGLSITPILESNNTKVTITHIENNKFSISLDATTDVDTVALTFGFNYVDMYRRNKFMPINYSI